MLDRQTLTIFEHLTFTNFLITKITAGFHTYHCLLLPKPLLSFCGFSSPTLFFNFQFFGTLFCLVCIVGPIKDKLTLCNCCDNFTTHRLFMGNPAPYTFSFFHPAGSNFPWIFPYSLHKQTGYLANSIFLCNITYPFTPFMTSLIFLVKVKLL